jgi:hypothetical protein
LEALTAIDASAGFLAGIRGRGDTDNAGQTSPLADRAQTLIDRFHRFEEMILRFATDLSVPFTNNEAERAIRPVKIQQRTSGGCWRTLQDLTDFAVVRSYLDTATKWGLDKLDVLHQLSPAARDRAVVSSEPVLPNAAATPRAATRPWSWSAIEAYAQRLWGCT